MGKIHSPFGVIFAFKMMKTSQITFNCLRMWIIRPKIPSAALISLCLTGPQRCNHEFLCSCHISNSPHPTLSLIGKSSLHLDSSSSVRIATFQPVFNLILLPWQPRNFFQQANHILTWEPYPLAMMKPSPDSPFVLFPNVTSVYSCKVLLLQAVSVCD